MKTIGIVCEGPTDFIVIKCIIDMLTGEENLYRKLQPEETLAGRNGNGWKGVVKWCRDNCPAYQTAYHRSAADVFRWLKYLRFL